MGKDERKSTALRRMLQEPGPIVAPCAFDAVSARVVEMAGIPVVMHGGFNPSASLHAMADVGTITQTEMIEHAGRMVRAVDIPVIADVDDGFGKSLNVARTTREAIRVGVAGMHIEDQALPKRCTSLGGHPVISTEEMLTKLHAARLVRDDLDPDFVIIARTHASLAIDFEEGLRRGEIYAEEGKADLIWVDLGYDDGVHDELKAIAERVAPHTHVIANMTENVGRPLLTTDELYSLGFKFITYPITLILAATTAMRRVAEEIAGKGTHRAIADEIMPVKEFREIVRFAEVEQLEQRLEAYVPPKFD